MRSHFVRCKNGHVYDSNAYSSCPICSRAEEDYTQYKINSADAEAMTVRSRENTMERSIQPDMGDRHGSISEDVMMRYANYKRPVASVDEGKTLRLADAGIAAAKVDPVSVVLQEDGRERQLQYQTEKVGGRIPLAPMPLERVVARKRSAAPLPPGGSGRMPDAKLPVLPQKTEGSALEMPDWMPKDSSGTDVLPRMTRTTGADADMTAPTPEEEPEIEAPAPMPEEELRIEASVAMPEEELRIEAPVAMPEEGPGTEVSAAKLLVRPVGWLVCVQGPDLGSSFLLREGKNMIGKRNGSAAVLEEGTVLDRDVLAWVEYRESERVFYAHIGEGAHPVGVRLQKNDILYFGECALMLIPCCDGQFSWQDVR